MKYVQTFTTDTLHHSGSYRNENFVHCAGFCAAGAGAKFCTLSDFLCSRDLRGIWHIHSTQCFVPRWTSALQYTPLKWPSTCRLRCFAAHSYYMYIVVECWRKVLLSLLQFLTVACCSSQLSLARSVLPCWFTWPTERRHYVNAQKSEKRSVVRGTNFFPKRRKLVLKIWSKVEGKY